MADWAFRKEQEGTRKLMDRLYRCRWKTVARETVIATVPCHICAKPAKVTKWTRSRRVADGCSPKCRRLLSGRWLLHRIGERANTVTGWAKLHRIDPETVRYRMRQGWPMERALTTPITPHGNRRWKKAA
jgi:endogenous inhibitor of DNA gyrase (YacG/DUF329 family)